MITVERPAGTEPESLAEAGFSGLSCMISLKTVAKVLPGPPKGLLPVLNS